MKKNYSFGISLFVSAACCLFGSTAAKAEAASGDASARVAGYVIELDTPYTVTYTTPVYSYTAGADGILSVEWSGPNGQGFTSAVANGMEQYFLYSSELCEDSSLVAPLSVSAGEQGYIVKFIVKRGDVYYLHLDFLGSLTCVFSLEAGATATASITNIQPTPGGAYDTVNFHSSFNVVGSPSNLTTEGVTLTYVPAGESEATTIETANGSMDGDAYRCPASDIVRLLEANEIADGTDIVVTLLGTRANGSYVEEYTGPGREYVVVGEEGRVEITFTASTAPVPLSYSFPDPLYNRFAAGNPEAVGYIVYSSDIESVSEVSVVQGHIVQGGQTGGDNPPASVYIPASNVTVEGNTVYIDFGGVDLSDLPVGEVTLYIPGVLGTNGLYADYDGFSVGTYYLTLADGESGIGNVVGNAEGVWSVYDLGGVNVLNAENASMLRDLRPGIYVVNGRKVLLRN